jgi:hypothetical protein
MPWVRIHKPVVTYDLRKFSLTKCARLPNYFKINLLSNFVSFKNFSMVFALKYCISISKMTSAMVNKNGKIYRIKTFGNVGHKFRHIAFQ